MELTETTLNLKLSELDNELSFPLDDLFFLEITDDTHRTEIKYEFLIRFSSINTNLIVFGNAAYKPQEIKVEPPIFMRHSWEKQFQESVIYFYDPTIYNYPEYGVGWGVGDDIGWYLQNIARIISILAQKIKVANENILFVGSSAGGFMALALSTLLKESSALVNNPQIDLRKHREIIDSISDYYFNKQNKEEILSKLAYRFDVVELFKKEKYMPNITYCCNVDSNPDLNVDLQYLITETSKLKEEYFNYPDVNVVLYSHPNGHSGLLDQERQIHMIKEHFKVSFKEKSMSSLYIDMGGFNERYKEQTLINPGEDIQLYYNLEQYKDIKHLRFHPIIGLCSKCNIKTVTSDAENINIYHNTNYEKEEQIFLTDDPQYLIQGDFQNATYIIIKYSLEILTNVQVCGTKRTELQKTWKQIVK